MYDIHMHAHVYMLLSVRELYTETLTNPSNPNLPKHRSDGLYL